MTRWTFALLAGFVATLHGCSFTSVGPNDTPKIRAEPGPSGTKVTLVQHGLALRFPDERQRAGELCDLYDASARPGCWKLGPSRDGHYLQSVEVRVTVQPVAESLAEAEATLRVGCLRSEVQQRASDARGFEMSYTCLTKRRESLFGYWRTTSIGGQKVECLGVGSLGEAKAAKQTCASLHNVPREARP